MGCSMGASSFRVWGRQRSVEDGTNALLGECFRDRCAHTAVGARNEGIQPRKARSIYG